MDSKQIKALVLRCLDMAQERGLATSLCNTLCYSSQKQMSLDAIYAMEHIYKGCEHRDIYTVLDKL
jgi:hypothetical protein